MAASRLNVWLTQMTYWRDGKHPNEAHLLAFQYLGENDTRHDVRLVDIGLPERAGEPRRKPTFGPVIHMVQESDLVFKKFALYVVMTPKVQDNVLIIRKQGLLHGCCRIPSGRDDVEKGWIELFCGGMGAWSYACEALGHEVAIVVDKDPLACAGYEKNHGLRPFQGDVADARWVPFEPKEGFLTSPPCPIFSNLTGAGGFASSANSGWDDLLFMLRFVLPPLLLLENPTFMHQRLGEVRDFMKLAGYRLQNIQSIQLANFSPMRRDRSISIWVRDTDLDTMHYDNSHPWRPLGNYHTLLSFSCIAPPELCAGELRISEQQRQVLSDPAFGGKSTRAQHGPNNLCTQVSRPLLFSIGMFLTWECLGSACCSLAFIARFLFSLNPWNHGFSPHGRWQGGSCFHNESGCRIKSVRPGSSWVIQCHPCNAWWDF